MASIAGICNMALSHIGVGKEIANLTTEQSQEAAACRRFYDIAKDVVLRDFPWPFATKVDTLALIEEDPNVEWAFSYRYPTDCHLIRKVLSGTRNDTQDSVVPYKIAQDSSGLVLFCDVEDAEIEYTVHTEDPQFYTPDFTMALSFLLAHYIAPRLTGGDPFKLGIRAVQMYDFEIRKARSNAINEERMERVPESEFIRGRE